MPTYRLTISRYESVKDAVRLGPWQRGHEVDLSEADAAWVNADSSGALELVLPPEPEPAQELAPEPVVSAPEVSASTMDVEVDLTDPPGEDTEPTEPAPESPRRRRRSTTP